MSSIIDSLAKLAEKFSQKYPGEASGVAELDANARIPTDQAFSTGGSDTHKAMGVIDSQFTEIGNVGSGDDDLMSYTLPADTLDVNGKAIRITAWGLGNGIDNVSLRLWFGSIVIGFVIPNNPTSNWYSTAVVIRGGVGIQTYGISGLNGIITVMGEGTSFNPAQDETAAIIIKFSGANNSDTSNDAVTQQGMIVEILN